MTAYTKNTPGAPTGGFYTLNDTVTDSNSVVWTCVRTGFAATGLHGVGYGSPAQFTAAPASAQVNAVSNGVLGVAGVLAGASVVEKGSPDGVHSTIITLAGLSTTIVDANVAGSKLLYTFPEGRILVLGCTANALAPTTTSVIASTLNAAVACVLALGSAAAAADATLTSTEANILPSTGWTSSATINVAAASVNAALAASAQIDGTATAVPVYLNMAVTTNTDIDADATVTWTGVITIKWVFLGDY